MLNLEECEESKNNFKKIKRFKDARECSKMLENVNFIIINL